MIKRKSIKWFKTFLLVTLPLTIVACDDELYTDPNDRIQDENAFKTEADFRNGVDAAYDAFKIGGYYNGDTSQNIIPDIISDNLIINPLGRRSNSSAYIFDFAATNTSITNLYGAGYFVASRANYVLSKVSNLPSSAFMTNIQAEARAIRAIAHFDVVRAYAKIPTQSSDANGSLGIFYSTQFDPFQTPARDNSVSQVYDKIIADLIFARDNITQNDVDKGRLSKAAVLGMLSRVYLYKGDYVNAIASGQACLAINSDLGSLTNFGKIWKDETSDGVLFKILNSSVESIKTGTCYNQTISGQIKSEYNVDYDLFTKYLPNDIRKTAYIQTSSYQGSSFNHIIKYRQATGKPIEVVDIKYLRTAEVVLNIAEAMYKTGNESGALSLLNQLRAERYTGFVSGTETGVNLWNAIMLQRRLELAFETDRFFTLKRLGLPIQRSSFGPFADGSGTPTPENILNPASHKWQLPIPFDAITLNPNIKQNDGY